MNKESRTKITGKNFLLAVLAALTSTIIVTLIYSLMAFLVNRKVGGDSAANSTASRAFFSLLKTVGLCIAPIAFLITFALLQRFRIKK